MFWELGGPMFALCELFIIDFQFSKEPKTTIMNWLKSLYLIVTILIIMRGLNSKKILRTTKNLHEFNRDSYAEVHGSKLKSVCTDNFDFKNLSMFF